MRNVSGTICRENQNIRFPFNDVSSSKKSCLYEITWRSTAEQIAIWRMRIACWIPKATNTHTVCVILMAFPLQQWLHKRASLLRFTYIACVIRIKNYLLDDVDNNNTLHVTNRSLFPIPVTFHHTFIGFTATYVDYLLVCYYLSLQSRLLSHIQKLLSSYLSIFNGILFAKNASVISLTLCSACIQHWWSLCCHSSRSTCSGLGRVE
jgi:hypothetical protein